MPAGRGIALDWSDPRIDVFRCDWASYDLDDVSWESMRRSQPQFSHQVFLSAEGFFAHITDGLGRPADLTAAWTVRGTRAYAERLKRTALLDEHQLRVLGAVQALVMIGEAGLPSSWGWASHDDLVEATAWVPIAREIALRRSDEPRIDVPLLSDPASVSAFERYAQQQQQWVSREAEPAVDVIGVIGTVVDGALRRSVEFDLGRGCRPLPRQTTTFAGEDPFCVLRAVVVAAGPTRGTLVTAIRELLEQPSGTAELERRVAPQQGGLLSDIRTVWSSWGPNGSADDRDRTWWSWLADALDGTVAIPEEIFWDGPRDPLTLDEVMNP